MLIQEGGNVGIGTNDPSQKLEVRGSSSMTFIRVATNGLGGDGTNNASWCRVWRGFVSL